MTPPATRPGSARAGPATPLAPPSGPDGARRQVAHYLGVVAATEEQLRDALILVAERHERNYEISRGATVLAIWSSEHVTQLERQRARYGRVPSEAAELLRSALLGGARIGVVGELDDICDLAVLAQKAEMTWTIVIQGAHELHDDELLDVASTARDQARRQIAWLRTTIEHEAPDAIAVVPDWSGQLAATVPKRPEAVAAVPDLVWGPIAAAGLILLVGLVGLVIGRPWLLPSLGPSAALIALSPAHPTARLWNTLVGHLLGIVAGFAGIALAGAALAPSPLLQGDLVPSRVIAATIAVALTLLLGALARATHAPATAT
ncbi:MAG: HPP family protein, partial [Chloroflexota bacterium]